MVTLLPTSVTTEETLESSFLTPELERSAVHAAYVTPKIMHTTITAGRAEPIPKKQPVPQKKKQ